MTKMTSQEKAVVITFVLFVAMLFAGFIAVVVIESRNAVVCGSTLKAVPNAPKPTPPPGKA
jgi:hypothetical protein